MQASSTPAMPVQQAKPVIIHTVSELREWVQAQRKKGKKIGFVPTMGALHSGHLSLVELAGQNADTVITSIFVNPTQFAPHEDFDSYPRTLEDDVEKLSQTPCECVFAPNVDEMYPQGFATSINFDAPITATMEGAARPGFFNGVAIIVSKLLLQVLADVAVFGEKDYQQLQMVKQLVRDLNIPTQIIGAPIIRDDKGLAQSSRNAYLNEEQYNTACSLNVILAKTCTELQQGADVAGTIAKAKEQILAAGFESIDYLDLRDANSLVEFTSDKVETTGQLRLITTARIDGIRLLDNMAV